MTALERVTIDSRFTQPSGYEVFAGNELLVKGCLEAEGGTHLWTGYPGSPVSAFFDVAQDIKHLLNEWGIRATVAHNEALGVAMVNGSQMHGLRAVAVQKSVGLHVAADALALGNLVGAHPEGGAVIIMGDDPWSDSTQVPADSRFLAKHLMMPVLEPSDPQEIKDWIGVAFELSRASELYIGYLVTTHQVDGGGTVSVRPNQRPETNMREPFSIDTRSIDLERNVLLPPRTWRKEQEMPQRVERLWKAAKRLGVHKTLFADQNKGAHSWGVITSAAAYNYLRHALVELGMDGLIPILKLGITYPLDPSVILEFCEGRQNILVVEERRGFLEEQVVSVVSASAQLNELTRERPKVWGKKFPTDLPGIPASRGLNPSILVELIGRLVLQDPGLSKVADLARIRAQLSQMAKMLDDKFRLPLRTPTFCPGCPHRDSSSLLLRIKQDFRKSDYMQSTHGIGPVDLVFHGDTGCYTMLMFEPNSDLMHNYSGMGLGGGTGAGIDPFIRNKQVVFMGDSTFFHSGQIAISNSVKNRQDITYIILDNKTTAMTGHQPTASTEESVTGEVTFVQNIQRIVDAMTSASGAEAMVVRVNPEQQVEYRRLLEKSILADGVKVIIADKECGITFHRREARAERAQAKVLGFVPEKRHINITPEVCENCLECTKSTGCPGLTFEETPYGRKVVTDLTWCVADGACTRFMVPAVDGHEVKACPSFEEVIISRSQPPLRLIDRLDFSGLKLPENQVGTDEIWRGYLAGVGGMGIGTAAAVLVLAAHREGLAVQFVDKKGLAIRNGGVYSMLTLSRPNAPFTSNLFPYGKADLILGVDILEAARALDPAVGYCVGSRVRTRVVVNRHKTPTIRHLLGDEEWNLDEVEEVLKNRTKPGDYVGANVTDWCERAFGTQIYVNLVLLGMAFQKGYLPFSLESVRWAIATGMRGGADENFKAFQLGRFIVSEGVESAQVNGLSDSKELTWEDIFSDKLQLLARNSRRGADKKARFEFMTLARSTLTSLKCPDALKADLVRRIYDALIFDGIEYARKYCDYVSRVNRMEPEGNWSECRLTRAVIWNLHKVMVIKDEIYVAHLLTSEEKRRRDFARFNVNPSRGDRIEYRHLNRPEFVLFGQRFAWDMVTRDWMLKLMSRMKWLRRLLPGWHRVEREFRDWYLGLIDRLEGEGLGFVSYDGWVQILSAPEEVTGYREVRYPKIEKARAQVSEFLKNVKAQSLTQPSAHDRSELLRIQKVS